MNTAPEILFGVGIVVLLGALVWGTLAYRRRDRRLDPIRERQATAVQRDTRTAPAAATDNRWLLVAVCICAVVLGGFAVYSYNLTGEMQQVAADNGTTAKGADTTAFPNRTTPPKRSDTNAPSSGGG